MVSGKISGDPLAQTTVGLNMAAIQAGANVQAPSTLFASAENNLSDLGNTATALTNLGGLSSALAASTYLTQAAAASTYQPLTANLTSWAAITRAAGFDTFAAAPSSANFLALLTTKTGTGSAVFATSPTLVTPTLGAASATSIANALGLVGTPSYTFTGDLNTGMYSPGADTIAFSTAGAQVGVMDSGGRVLFGTETTQSMNIIGTMPKLQLHGSDTETTTIAQTRWQNTITGVQHYLNHSKGATIGTHALLADGDGIGSWISGISDGVKFIDGTSIQAVADGAQALDNTPSALNFRTNSGGTATTIKARLTAAGQKLIGHIAAILVGGTSNQTPLLQVHGLGTDAQAGIFRWAASTGGSTLGLVKSRGVTAGARAIVASGDTIGSIQAFGDDGTNFPPAARIQVVVDGTPGAGDMPGRIELATTADGASSVTTRAVIDSRGFTSLTGSFGTGLPITKNADFTLADTENDIIVTKGSSCTATIPAASLWPGRELWIKTTVAFTTVSASSNVVPLAGGAAGTAILPAVAGSWARLKSDATNWVIMGA